MVLSTCALSFVFSVSHVLWVSTLACKLCLVSHNCWYILINERNKIILTVIECATSYQCFQPQVLCARVVGILLFQIIIKKTKIDTNALHCFVCLLSSKKSCWSCVLYFNHVPLESSIKLLLGYCVPLFMLQNVTNLGVWQNKDRRKGRAMVCCCSTVFPYDFFCSMWARWCRLPVEWCRHLQSRGPSEQPQ